ncbi:non-ribosomal peptide synthetase (plasmid) [Kitasatospora sp. NBC_00070]|uniref:non-ribosomal peptide synthetase n=1 Tax=Kitasatospora sp. NBC_00070 TaxID=2975962 RepID=UPI002F914CBA
MHTSITAAYLTRYRSVAADPAELLPLTGAQRRFLLSRRMRPQGRPDTVPLFFAFPHGTVDIARLHRAALLLADRHPVLRARFTTVRGTPVLRLGEPSAEVTAVIAEPGHSAQEALRLALLAWPADGPTLKLLLASDPGRGEELLAVALDHAACDEQSLGIVTAGLTEAYARTETAAVTADDDGLAAYREAVDLQLAAEEAAAGPAAHAHWAARLASLDDRKTTAGPGPDHAGTEGTRHPAAEPRPTGMIAAQLPPVAATARGTVFPALLDAVTATGHRLLGADRTLALGYPWGGRPPGAPPVLGCFLNTLVHPGSPDPSGPADLDSLGDHWWDDLEHAATPFDEVVHAARSAGARWSGALDGLLTFEDLQRRPPLILAGHTGRETHLAGRPIGAPFAVAASHGDELLVRLAWDRDRCQDQAAEAAFETLLDTLRHHLGPAPATT